MSSGEDSLMGRTLRDGVHVHEKVRETPVGGLYRAEDASGLEVAVLVLATTDSVTLAHLRNRFRRAMEIRHSNVAAIHAVGEIPDGRTYVVAESLTGELLSTVLARRAALSVAESLDIVLQAAAGLQAAHEARWVHGNLSPDTILLSQTPGGYPIVKLIGFSRELLMPDETSSPKQRPVSAYASPERIAGEATDQRTDVFSLGAVLSALLTNAPPDRDANDDRIPEAVQVALDRALDPEPSGRFRTIAEFAAALSATRDAPEVAQSVKRKSRAAEYRTAAALVAIAAGLWLLGSGHKPTANVPNRSAAGESGAVPDAAIRPTPPFARRQPPRPRESIIRHDSAAARVPTSSSVRQPDSAAIRDSISRPRISPFSRAHPWAAVPGKKFYYRSTCPVALQSRDLIYFQTEAEARAAGFKPTETPECR